MKLLGVAVLFAMVAVLVGLVTTSGSAAAKQPRHAIACPSAARSASLPRWKSGGLLRADIDGDGKADAVSIRFDKWAPARCAFYLRLVTAEGRRSLALGSLIGNFTRDGYNAPIRSWYGADPAVKAIVDLGGRGNLIALLDNAGAADDFVDFIGLSHGRLRVIHTSLDLGGSVMSVHGAACARGGPLREWSVYDTASQTRWAFAIETYRRHGWQFTTVAHKTEHGSEKAMWRAARRAGVSWAQPLAGCSLARDRHFFS